MIGPTNEYPKGKLNAADKGELSMGIYVKDDSVIVIEFGNSVRWLGLYPEQARQLAKALLKHADAIEVENAHRE